MSAERGVAFLSVDAAAARRKGSVMAAIRVPRYLAESATASGEHDLRAWVARLHETVADFACRWSLRVGEPFEPGGRCSWVAPATDAAGTDLVLKVGYRFPGGEERDEAAGLRLWNGNGAVRLHAAHDSEAAYGLLLERCRPGTALSQVVPEAEQDQVVARLLRQLWAQPREGYQFRPLAQMCQAWADEFERHYASADAADRIDPGLARAGIVLFRSLSDSGASGAALH